MSQQNAAALSQLVRWREDPAAFLREGLQVDPEPWQIEAIEAVRDNDKVAVRSGHGVGKSALMSWIIIWWLATRYPAKVACTAPTQHQLYDILWSELARWQRKLPVELREQFAWTAERYALRGAENESFAVARTARPETPEALQGFHSEHMMFLVEEASGVADIVFEVGEGAMSTEGAKTFMAGNPTRPSGYFFEAFTRMRGLWRTLHVPCSRSRLVGPKYAASMAQKYGIDSNVYRVRVLGEFPRSEDDVVMPLDMVEAAIARAIGDQDGYKVVWGLDVARFGGDANALCKRRHNQILGKIQIWTGVDLMQTAGRVVDEYHETEERDRPGAINVDVIGLGAGVYDRLRELGLPARAVNVSESAATKERFARLRDELWWRGREWFESRMVGMPDDGDLVGELTAVKYTTQSNGRIKVEGKDDLKKRGLPSPNRADAFLLSLHGRDIVTTQRASAVKSKLASLRRPGGGHSNSWMQF